MANEDIARIGTDWRKRYSATGMQQGRPLMEEDWNENRRLTSEEKRRALLDIIGDVGTPDSGFRIDNPQVTKRGAVDALDFTTDAGTLYLGGQRLEMPVVTPPSFGDTYLLQSDWLEQDGADIFAPPNQGKTLTTFAYVEAWEQPVTAVEDSELFEAALGGPDTSTRMRMMWRVHLADAGTSTSCQDAWTALTGGWSAAGLGTIGPGGERIVDTTLTVNFSPGSTDDLCNPPVAGGYLGADNQAIRVQIVDADPKTNNFTFTWGFDDASPVYRVTLGTDAQGKKNVISFLTTPKDEAHWPLTGMVVEVLAWSAVLPNNEKLAEIQGKLTRVQASYDPDTQTLQVIDDLTGFGVAWQSRSDANSLADANHPAFYYLRVWDRGGDITSPVAIPFTLNDVNPVALGTTGLGVTFDSLKGEAAPVDYWVIGARPSTPNDVVPWRLKNAAPLHGIRRFYAPLGVIVWSADAVTGNVTGVVVDDCRPPFLPLTRLRGCCTVIVGDGVLTFGDVTSVQAAVDALPPDGGEICVLPGTYAGAVSLAGHQNVTIQGCEGRSILTLGAADTATAPVISLDGSNANILIRDLAIEATTGPGVAWGSDKLQTTLSKVTLSELEISTRDMSAIFGRGGAHIVVERCQVQIQQLSNPIDPAQPAGTFPAIFLLGDDMRIERNDVWYVGAGGTTVTPLGGIQIGGGSDGVGIRRNRIFGGLGNGITLGSVRLATTNDLIASYRMHGASFGSDLGTYIPYAMLMDAGGCVNVGPPPAKVTPPGGASPPISEGALKNIRIIDNQIKDMGNDGIASIALYDDAKIYISISELWIEENEIRACVQLPRGDPTNGPLLRARGGIILADAEAAFIRGNTIASNGTGVAELICGIYLQFASDVDISLNRIVANGITISLITRESFARSLVGITPSPAGGTALGEVGGGIIIDLALVSPLTALSQLGSLLTIHNAPVNMGARAPIAGFASAVEAPKVSGGVAARIEANEVSAPNGRALEVVASGQVAVHGNSFAAMSTRGFDILGFFITHQPPRLPLDFLGGAAVAILDLGISYELLGNFFGYLLLPLLESLDPAVKDDLQQLAGGDVQFSDNQVELNLLNQQLAVTLSSVLLLSADDIAMNDNQCNVLAQLVAIDIVIAHALCLGVSVRMRGNRMKEGSLAALLPTLSGATIGIFNTTAENQGTHCFFALGLLLAGNTYGLDNLSLLGGGKCNEQTQAIAGNMTYQFVNPIHS